MHSHAPDLDSPPLVRIGLPEYVKLTSPAAGAAFTASVPGQYYERLVTVFCRLVTSATVAERQVYLQYTDPEGQAFAIAGAPVTQSESSTNDYAFQAFLGQSDWPVNDTILVTLPPVLLLPTFSWTIGVDNIDTTDAITRVRVFRERFYTGQPISLG